MFSKVLCDQYKWLQRIDRDDDNLLCHLRVAPFFQSVCCFAAGHLPHRFVPVLQACGVHTPANTASWARTWGRPSPRTATSHRSTKTGPSRAPCIAAPATTSRGRCTGAAQVGTRVTVSWIKIIKSRLWVVAIQRCRLITGFYHATLKLTAKGLLFFSFYAFILIGPIFSQFFVNSYSPGPEKQHLR